MKAAMQCQSYECERKERKLAAFRLLALIVCAEVAYLWTQRTQVETVKSEC